ncbi:MAG TPA: hypothetical protein VFJ90_13680 [Candidatus Didemnitutus sp.]|nr:hypothetical protein [Candidatus Didemnitutus sp.]
MKTLRIILIALLALYGLGPLVGAAMSLFNPAKLAAWQQLGEITPGLEKSLQLSGGMLAGQVWLYFSAIALLATRMKEGYMYAVTIGFIELIQAAVIVIGLRVHHVGSVTDFFALLKGGLLLAIALAAFTKNPRTCRPPQAAALSGGHAHNPA